MQAAAAQVASQFDSWATAFNKTTLLTPGPARAIALATFIVNMARVYLINTNPNMTWW